MPCSRLFPSCLLSVGLLASLSVLSATWARADESMGPEQVLRRLVQANVEKDLATMSRLMAHDEDVINYSIEGRKFVGWDEFAQVMKEEFSSAKRIEIPIVFLKVWQRGDTAWFVMELDYTRYLADGQQEVRMMLPLRETGVLERRNGRWILVTWHESFRGQADIGAGEGQPFKPLF